MELYSIKINNVEQLIDFSTVYLKGELKMNLSKVARDLNCDRKTVSINANIRMYRNDHLKMYKRVYN